MSEQNPQQTPLERFFFDRNNFDDPFANDEDIEPTYSEEELKAAKEASFAEGKANGLEQAAKSREQKLALTMDRIAQNFKTIFSAENTREERYEEEVIRIITNLLATLFPMLNARYGLEELKSIIKNTLETHSEQTDILIEVSPDLTEDVEKSLEQAETFFHEKKRFCVQGNNQISDSDCKISWKDGGSVRQTHNMVESVIQEFQELIDGPLDINIIRDVIASKQPTDGKEITLEHTETEETLENRPESELESSKESHEDPPVDPPKSRVEDGEDPHRALDSEENPDKLVEETEENPDPHPDNESDGAQS